MGKAGKRKAAKTRVGEKSPSAPSSKKQNAEKSIEEVPEGEDEVELEEEDEKEPEGEGDEKEPEDEGDEKVPEGEGDEEDEEDTALISSNVQLAAGGDVIELCRVLAPDQCPRIPLCRLVPYAKVRGLRKNLGSLKAAFTSERYVPEKGTFIVSLIKNDGEELKVNEDITSTWDPLWKEVDNEFEKDLANRKDLKSLSKKMFFVWEGNHRTKAWMEVISTMYDKANHVRVMCTIIDPRKVPEIALLACLQRMNV